MNTILDKYEVDISTVSSMKIRLDECRIDPKFFSSNQNFINDLVTLPISTFCEAIFNPPVFKRDFLEDENECRYLASAEIVILKPDVTYITNEQADRLKLRVKKNWVLVTGFGTVGSIRIVDEIINGYAVANNVTRLITKSGFEGFIAAYLESSFGNKLLNDYAAGAVIKYIEAPQIAKIPVPVIDIEQIKSINDYYIKAVTCRERSNALLEEAQTLVLKYNLLPSPLTCEIKTLDPQNNIEVRNIDLLEINDSYRLDAHFYNPIAKAAIDNIHNNSIRYLTLKDVTDNIVIGKRFKRNYVESDHGTPFIGSKNIFQIRPTELKYLSNTEIGFMSELMLNKNMILIACSGSLGGTFGKAGFVYENFENYAASQHILRVIANESLIDSGYLYAYLSSEYGYECITRYRWGALIDEIDDEDMSKLIIPLPKEIQQKEIGDLVRQAHNLRADAIRFEDEAQDLLTKALTKA